MEIKVKFKKKRQLRSNLTFKKDLKFIKHVTYMSSIDFCKA